MLSIAAIACGHRATTTAPAPAVNAPEPSVLRTTLTETEPCQERPSTDAATAAGEQGAIVIDARGVQRSCRASFTAAAGLSRSTTGGGDTLRVSITEHEDPPYSGCLCFRDLRLRVDGLNPGRYHVEAPRLELVTDVTVR